MIYKMIMYALASNNLIDSLTISVENTERSRHLPKRALSYSNPEALSHQVVSKNFF